MQHIVVGVDGSEGSRRALEWAVEEASRWHASLEIVHSWEVSFAPTSGTLGIEVGTFEAAAQRVLEAETTSVASPDVMCTKRLAYGGAAGVLIDASKQADLVVVGTRGRGGFAGLLLGSVSRQLVQHAACPVVVVPPSAPGDSE